MKNENDKNICCSESNHMQWTTKNKVYLYIHFWANQNRLKLLEIWSRVLQYDLETQCQPLDWRNLIISKIEERMSKEVKNSRSTNGLILNQTTTDYKTIYGKEINESAWVITILYDYFIIFVFLQIKNEEKISCNTVWGKAENGQAHLTEYRHKLIYSSLWVMESKIQYTNAERKLTEFKCISLWLDLS